MRSTRSGAPPRFWPYRSPEYWVMASEFFVFELLFGLIPLIACIIAFQSCGRSAAEALVDPAAPIHRLDKPLSDAEKARGVIRAGGRLAGAEEVCLVTHEYKSGKSWKEDFRGTLGGAMAIEVEYEHGHALQVPERSLAVDWSNVRWEPEMIRKESHREAFWRKQVSIPSGGRLYESCLRKGERVFIAACETMDKNHHAIAVACGTRRSVVTPGDGTPQPRIDQLAATAAGEVSLLGGAMLLILLYLWRVGGARPFCAGLIKRLGRPLSATVARSALWVIGLAPIGLLIGLYLFRGVPGGTDVAKVDRYGYALAYAIFGGALVLGLLLRDRRRALRPVIDAVAAEAPGSIAHLKEGQRVAIEAKVDPLAPVSPGLLTGTSRAHWAVSVTRVYRNGRNYASVAEPDHPGPSLVPIQGVGGAALLELTGAVVDLRARRAIAKKRAMRKGSYRQIVGQMDKFVGAYVLEERYLDPGEAIYVAGHVRRLAAPSVEVGYREVGGIPVIGGTPEEPVVVHAGSRRSLLRGLSLEQGFITAALALAGMIGAGTAGLVGYLISL